MRLSWPATIAAVVSGYFFANALFALLYYWCGGIAHARPGMLRDAFFFSVQTMGTIGYGAMYPVTDLANALVALESATGLLLVALATGLVFAKFSRPTARLLFSHHATLSPMNGEPTLSFRIGNLRDNRIVEAEVRLALVRTEHLREGGVFYRMVDMKLSRSRAVLARSWQVLHVVDEASPLFGETPASLAAQDAEMVVTVAGLDDTWMQTVVASHRYDHSRIRWGFRHVDVLREEGNVLTLDLSAFHDVVASEPTPSFPYPEK
jgi:inward rectifier potassium channel